MATFSYSNLVAGDTAPWFTQRTSGNPRYVFDTTAGRYLVLCFLMSGGDSHAVEAVKAARSRPDFFDDGTASFFAVTTDPDDEKQRRIPESLPGYRVFWDFDGAVSRLYGSLPAKAVKAQKLPEPRRLWVVLDPTMRVLKVIPFRNDRGDIAEFLDFIDRLPPPSRFAGFELQAPILVLPNVFEMELCERLIGLYEANGGTESGFMREIDGKTVLIQDHGHKRRKDYNIEDQTLIKELQARFIRKVVPQIQKAHQFKVSRMERYIVSCYAAEDEAHFRAHRDNTTKGTAHRRFAVSINLNSDFDGGEVSFPEYGPRSFKAPPGGAVVFSCSLLHAVSKVTRGRRYAFLPFLYDDEAAAIREANNRFLGEGVGAYKQPETEQQAQS
jgi:predicted 2-oxoglutarate/Fe(II)-dependent dioxygenase YbiX/peroxiredoxin